MVIICWIVAPGAAVSLAISCACLLMPGETAAAVGEAVDVVPVGACGSALAERLMSGLLHAGDATAVAGLVAFPFFAGDFFALTDATDALGASRTTLLGVVAIEVMDLTLWPFAFVVIRISWLFHHDFRGGEPVTLYVRQVSSHFKQALRSIEDGLTLTDDQIA